MIVFVIFIILISVELQLDGDSDAVIDNDEAMTREEL